MITKPNVEELLKKVSNRYELCCAVSKRARQIVTGDTPKTKTNETSEITISSLEFAEDKFSVVKK